jgi:hypothetical protein
MATQTTPSDTPTTSQGGADPVQQAADALTRRLPPRWAAALASGDEVGGYFDRDELLVAIAARRGHKGQPR